MAAARGYAGAKKAASAMRSRHTTTPKSINMPRDLEEPLGIIVEDQSIPKFPTADGLGPSLLILDAAAPPQAA